MMMLRKIDLICVWIVKCQKMNRADLVLSKTFERRKMNKCRRISLTSISRNDKKKNAKTRVCENKWNTKAGLANDSEKADGFTKGGDKLVALLCKKLKHQSKLDINCEMKKWPRNVTFQTVQRNTIMMKQSGRMKKMNSPKWTKNHKTID